MAHGRPTLIYTRSLQLPFSEIWQYGMLALALLLLVVALIILACQVCKCWNVNKHGKGIKRAEESWEGVNEGYRFPGERLQPSVLDHTNQPFHNVKIQEVQGKLEKLGLYFAPPSANRLSVDYARSDTECPERSQGKLKFSILYNKKRLELLLTVMEAVGLPCQGCLNTFVKVRLLSWASSPSPELHHVVDEWETHVVKNSSSPIFGEQFACSLRETSLTKSSVKLEVKHFDKYSRHIPLGEVRVALNVLLTVESMEFCEELKEVSKDTVGEVLVSLKCLPISQRIEVGLLKVKTALCDNSEMRVYARIDVFCNLRKQKHQKSKPKPLASVTVFNETFLFHLPEPVVWDFVVLISVYELHPSSRQLIGQAALGNRRSSDPNSHWDCMMQSTQQPVAKWHPLLI